MKIYQKIKLCRETKKLTQFFIAYELGMDQSQYSRREKGEIPFLPEEIVKLAKILNTTISNLFGEENNNEKNLIFEKLIEQYEIRLKEKDDIIVYLQKKNTNT